MQTYEVLRKVGAEHDFSAALIVGGTVSDLKKTRTFLFYTTFYDLGCQLRIQTSRWQEYSRLHSWTASSTHGRESQLQLRYHEDLG